VKVLRDSTNTISANNLSVKEEWDEEWRRKAGDQRKKGEFGSKHKKEEAEAVKPSRVSLENRRERDHEFARRK